MAKQREVIAHYKQRGLANSGAAFNADMRKAKVADESTTYHSAPVHRNAEVDAFYDDCFAKCMGSSSDDPEEGGLLAVALFYNLSYSLL